MAQIQLKKDTKCSICTCGKSKQLPLCDNAHRAYNEAHGTNYKSLKITPATDVDCEVTSSTWE